MSFLGGAECSTASNPLSQFTKHVQDDHSLQRDRLVGSGQPGLQESFRNLHVSREVDEAMQKALETPQFQLNDHDLGSDFSIEQTHQNLAALENKMGHQNGVDTRTIGWATEYQHQDTPVNVEAAFAASRPSSSVPPGFSPMEFQRFQSSYKSGRTSVQSNQNYRQNGVESSRPIPFAMVQPFIPPRMNNFGMAQRRFPTIQHNQLTTASAKGKSRMVELDDQDWEKEFAQIDSTEKEELDKQANEDMESELNRIDEDYVQQSSETNEFGDFESIWRGIQSEQNASMPNLSAEESRILHGDLPLHSFDRWDDFDGNFNSSLDPDVETGNYIFSNEESPLFGNSSNPFEEGMSILSSRGNLSLAASAFEAAVQRDPNHIEAWVMLGSAQAQNEKETQAIRAFEHALKLDPTNLSALMGLAISYTNEGYDATAYRTLEKWLSAKYPSILAPKDITPDADVGFTERAQLHDRVTQLYIRAAQLAPSGTAMDPDVQVGLGVLFYGAEKYTEAVDCFEAALASTESGVVKEPYQAHLLWNRLGATLANSGRSEEAIAAYGEALAMNPNFVRAKYNLGVSCINIGCLQEAAQHLLGALSLHEVVKEKGVEKAREVGGGGGSSSSGDRLMEEETAAAAGAGEEYGIGGLLGSTNLIETLRRVFNSMGRRDLAEKVETGVVDLEAFRGEFEF